MKNKNISMLDTEQMNRQEHDALTDAKRVVIVGGDGHQIAESIKQSLKDIKIEVSQDQIIDAIKNIKMPEFPKEHGSSTLMIPEVRIERIEIPTIIKEVEYKTLTIEKPVVVPEIRIIEIEKQVVVSKIVDSSSNLLKALLVVQTIAILFSLFLRK